MTHQIFCDFDGTISSCDVTDVLLEAFADPGWREIEAQWQAGTIGSAECMARQVALMHCTRDALDYALDSIVIDPGFADFVAFCRRIGASLTVVSDGLLYVVERVLASASIIGLAMDWAVNSIRLSPASMTVASQVMAHRPNQSGLACASSGK